MRLLREGILRRCTPTYTHTHTHTSVRGKGPVTALEEEEVQSIEGKATERGEGGERRARGPHRASTRVIRQPRRCRRCRRALTSTMRLVLSHTQGVSRPHILLLDAARRTSEREESVSERFTRRPPSERMGLARARARARGFLSVRWNLFEDFSEKLVNCVVAIAEEVRSNGEIGSIVRMIKAINLAFYRIYILHRTACDY